MEYYVQLGPPWARLSNLRQGDRWDGQLHPVLARGRRPDHLCDHRGHLQHRLQPHSLKVRFSAIFGCPPKGFCYVLWSWLFSFIKITFQGTCHLSASCQRRITKMVVDVRVWTQEHSRYLQVWKDHKMWIQLPSLNKLLNSKALAQYMISFFQAWITKQLQSFADRPVGLRLPLLIGSFIGELQAQVRSGKRSAHQTLSLRGLPDESDSVDRWAKFALWNCCECKTSFQ